MVKPHGIRGEVIVDMVSNRADARLAPGSVLACDGDDVVVVSSRPHQARWIVAFEGVGDRNSAEALRGRLLEAEPLPDHEAGTLWVHELIGSEVVDVAGRAHGMVVAVESNPASDLLVLPGERLVPLTFVVESEPGRVVVDPPAGLLEDADD